MKFVHISDLHIGQNAVFNKRAKQLVSRIARQYASYDEKPVVLITGDLVHDGLAEQYELAKDILFKLHNQDFKLLMCPGNHDYGSDGLSDDFEARQRYNRLALQLMTRDSDPVPGVDNVRHGQWFYPTVHRFDDVFFVGQLHYFQ